MSFRAIGAVLGLCFLFAAPPAAAEPWTRKSFLMPEGSFEITGDPARPAMMQINASRNGFAKPVYIAPHFYWAASDDVSLGISHQRGLCLNECDPAYNDAGFDMMVYLGGSDRFEIDLHAGIPISSFDPFVVGVRAGVLGRVNIGSITALMFDPSLYVGVTRRREGNREFVNLPFWFYFQATDVVVPFVGSAIEEPLDEPFHDFAPPLEGGVLFDVTQHVDLGFSLRFHHLLGPDSDAAARGLYFLGRFRI